MVMVLGLASLQAQTRQRLKLYVTNSEDDSITVIDLASTKVIGEIKVGERPHCAAAQPDGRRVFTTVESERALKVIDTATDQVVETIPVSGTPNQCAVTPNGRFVGVPIHDGDRVDIVDLEQKKVVKSLPVYKPHNCYNAHSDAHMFVTSIRENQVKMIDLATMSYMAEISVGGVPRPISVAHDEKTMYVALSDLHGFVIVDIAKRKVIDKVELPAPPPGAKPLVEHTPTHGLEISPDGKELWVTSVVGNGVYVYDIASQKLSNKIVTGLAPNWLAFSPDGKYCAVSNSGSDDVSIIETATRKEVARVKVGKMPKRLVAAAVPASAM